MTPEDYLVGELMHFMEDNVGVRAEDRVWARGVLNEYRRLKAKEDTEFFFREGNPDGPQG